MKIFVLAAFCLLISACNATNTTTANNQLPWAIKVDEAGASTVLGVRPGNITLRDFAKHFNQLADIKLFESEKGKLVLEAYLGKTKVGQFDARLIAELDAPETMLESIRVAGKDRKPTPNNYWQYNLNDQQLANALDLTVWRFMYIPIADYEEKQIGFFGQPESTASASDTAEYRFYPEKGVVVLWDKDGKETFYYSAPAEFGRLKQAINTAKTVNLITEDKGTANE